MPGLAGSQRRLWFGCGCVCVLLLGANGLQAANGDVLRIANALNGKEVVDICFDTDGTFWVVGANGSSTDSHRIYHLANDLSTLLGFVDNPHPPGNIATNNLTTNRGIAFRPLSRTLFILSSVGPRETQQFQVKEIRRDGAEVVTGAFTVSPPDADANLFGLAYGFLPPREFWSLDTQNDKVLRFGLDGVTTHSFTVPGKESPETVLQGQGISYALEGDQPRIYVSLGDIFRQGPAKIVQLTTDGVLVGQTRFGQKTGIEVPLNAVPTALRRGFEVFRRSLSLRRVALVGGTGQVFEIEQVVSNPLPPSSLTCTLTRTNQVVLSWENHGAGAGGSYGGEIQVLRNGVAFTQVQGDVQSFTDGTPVDGTSTYSLRSSASPGGSLSDESCECQVTVGKGGLVNWAPLPGSSLHDVTARPGNGEIFVTDSIQGRIFHYDSDLNLLGDIPSPWSNPGGIAYISRISLGFPPAVQNYENLLAVAEASGNRVRLIDLTPGFVGSTVTTINLRFAAAIAEPRIGGLTYVPSLERLVAVELTENPPMIHVMDKDGRLIRSCAPPEIVIGPKIQIDRAITYDPLQDTFLTLFTDGQIRELFVSTNGPCPPSGFVFDLLSLGEASSSPSFAAGIQIDGNTLLVCDRASNALFRVLIFPFSPSFVRGDLDRNNLVNVTDAVSLANYLFRSGPAPACQDAADANDDGSLDISDPVYLLFWLFVAASPAPPAPFPNPGEDPTFRDNLGCQN